MLHPDEPGGCWPLASASGRMRSLSACGSRRQWRRARQRSWRLPLSPGLCRSWAAPGRPPAPARRLPPRWSPARSSPTIASIATTAATPSEPPPPRIESLTLVGSDGSRRGRRGGPHLRRGAEPRPRPAEPSFQRRHSVLPGPAGAPDRLPPRGGQRRSPRARRDRRQGDGRARRGQPGDGGGSEADRAALRRRRLGPRLWAWSARASPSTPAASRSSPRPRCTR